MDKEILKRDQDKNFLNGYLACVQFIAISHGEDGLAAMALAESGYKSSTVFKAQKENGFETKRMNKIIREAIRRHKM